MNRLLSLKLKVAGEKDVEKFEKSIKKKSKKFTLQGVECPPEEELDESVLDPKPDDKPKEVKPEEKKEKKEKKEKPKVLVDDISDQDIDRLYARLPEFSPIPPKPSDFIRPEKSLKPPPKNENVVEISFPPKDQLKKQQSQIVGDKKSFVPSVDLLVRSKEPTGKIFNLTRKISINFSHTMYHEEVGTVSGKIDEDRHKRLQKRITQFVSVEPELPANGSWKWDSTTMLTFCFPTPHVEDDVEDEDEEEVEEEGELTEEEIRELEEKEAMKDWIPEPKPKGWTPSTKYTITIRAGTRSQRGYMLKKDVVFRFETPALHVKSFCPAGNYPRTLTMNPILGLEFSQDVDPAKLLKKLYIAETHRSEEPKKLVLVDPQSLIKRINEDDPYYVYHNSTNVHPGHVFMNSTELYKIKVETDQIDRLDPEKQRKLFKIIPKVRKFYSNVIFFTTKERLKGNTSYTCFVKKGLKPKHGNVAMQFDAKHQFQTMQNLCFKSYGLPSRTYENEVVNWEVKLNNQLNVDLWKEFGVQKWVKVENISNVCVEYDSVELLISIKGKIVRFQKEVSVKFSKKIEDIYGNTLSSKRESKIPILEREFKVTNYPKGRLACQDDVKWTFYFNWPISEKQDDDLTELVKVTPPLENQRFEITGNNFYVRGNPIGTELFEVRFSSKLKCIHDTEMVKDFSVKVQVKEESKLLTSQFNKKMFILDPTNSKFKTKYVFTTRNYQTVRVIVYQVTPESDFKTVYPMGLYPKQIQNVSKFCSLYDIYEYVGIDKSKIVFNKKIETNATFNEKKRVEFELKEHLQHPEQECGQLVVVIAPPDVDQTESPDSGQLGTCVISWIQVTQISFESLFTNNNQLTLIANFMRDGKFMHNVEHEYGFTKITHSGKKGDSTISERRRNVSHDIVVYRYFQNIISQTKIVAGNKNEGVTLVDFGSTRDLASTFAKYHIVDDLEANDYGKNIVTLRAGKDVAFVVDLRHSFERQHLTKSKVIPFVFDDKKIFKPDENMHVKAILRLLVVEFPNIRRLEVVAKDVVVKYSIVDSRDVKYMDKEIKIDENSSIYFNFKIPKNVNLGAHKIKFEIVDESGEYSGKVFEHCFKVEEFKKPEFIISCKTFDKNYFINDESLVTTNASYYSGAGLYNCKVDWTVKQQPDKNFRPLGGDGNFRGFSFALQPNFVSVYPNNNFKEYNMRPRNEYKISNSSSSKTDVKGECKLIIELLNPRPYERDNNHQLIKKRNFLREEAKLRTSKITIMTLSNGKLVVLPLLRDKCYDVFTTTKVTVDTRVTDISQNVLTSQTSFKVFPCKVFIGIKRKSNNVYVDEDLELEIVVCDVRGKPKKDIPIVLEMFRYNQKVREVFLKSEARKFEMKIPVFPEFGTGTFNILGTVFDENGFSNCSSISFQVNNAPSLKNAESKFRDIETRLTKFLKDDPSKYPEYKINDGTVEIITDKAKYNVADICRVTLKSSTLGSGFFFVFSHGIVYEKFFVLDNPKKMEISFELKCAENFVPNCRLGCFVTGNDLREDINGFLVDEEDSTIPRKPSHAYGWHPIQVLAKNFELEVSVVPAEKILSPSSESKCTVVVNRKGKSLLTLLIVDESVLTLTGYKLNFPITTFYPSNLIYTFEYFFRRELYVKKWTANLKKIEQERAKLIVEKQQLEKELDDKKLQEERSLEARKVREMNNQKMMQDEAKRRRLYQIKLELAKPKPPERDGILSAIRGFSGRLKKVATKSAPRRPMAKGASGGGGGGGMMAQLMSAQRSRRRGGPPRGRGGFRGGRGGFRGGGRSSRGGSSRGGRSRGRGRGRGRGMSLLQMKLASRRSQMEKKSAMDCSDDSDDDFDSSSDSDSDSDDDGSTFMMKRRTDEGKKGKRKDKKRAASSEEDEIVEDTGEETSPIAMRKLFESTVVFANSITTDENGKAIIPFKLPDNLTRYNIWVLAEQGTRYYGFGENSIVAKLPFSLRPQIPTYLNFGDRIQLSIILGNTSDKILRLKTAFRVSGGLFNSGKRGYVVTIPKGLRGEINFNVLARDVGEGRVQVAASAGKFNDAVEKPITVFSPQLVSNFVVYGELDADSVHVQQVIPPEEQEVYKGFGGLEIQTSSTVFQQLTDAFLYVYGYEFDCVEQAASRVLSIYSMVDICEKFKLDVDKREKIIKVMEKSLLKLSECQKDNGSFGFWSKSSGVNIYLSTHAAHSIVRIREKYPEIFKEGASAMTKKYNLLLERAKSFVMTLTQFIPVGYQKLANFSVRSFSLYVLSLYHQCKCLDEKESAKCAKRCKQLFKDYGNVDNQTNECKSWLATAISVFQPETHKEMINTLLNSLYKCVQEEKETAYFNSKASYGQVFAKLEMLGSSLRENGVILEMLCKLNPSDTLIPKVVKHLMKLKKFGKWGSTNENMHVLLGLTTYFNIFEKDEPDFTCEIWVKDDYQGGIAFKGRETDFKNLTVPMDTLVITSDEKKAIDEKKKQLEKKAEELKVQAEKNIEQMNKLFKHKFGELFEMMKKNYESEMGAIENDHLSEMEKLEKVLIKKVEEVTAKKPKEVEKKKKIRIFDFGSKSTEREDIDEVDIEYFQKQIDERGKTIGGDSTEMAYFEKKVAKNQRVQSFNERHFDSEEKILNSLKNKQVYIKKEGKGRLYYRMKFKYAPKDLKIHPFDFGFNVVRTYHHVDNKEDVVRDKKTGMYDIQYGSLVRVRVEFTTKQRRFHVALVDHVPSGLEVINPNLKTSIKIPRDPDYRYNKRWFEHVNYRHERVEVFKGELSQGTYHFSYVCRAKFVGSFVSVPAKVEEMYNEEICGGSETHFIAVEKKKEEQDDEDELEDEENIPPPP